MASVINKPRHWRARLDIGIERNGNRTVLAALNHSGPLNIQKPFIQTDGSCHLYILHPPGGVVGGDELHIQLSAGPSTRTTVTSPSAGKFYRCVNAQQQLQTISLNVGSGAHLEWVPQETIFFRGANAVIENEVKLAEDSSYLGWDILCLGRRASGEDFSQGSLVQSLRLVRAQQLKHRECLRIDSNHIQQSPIGLGGASIVGTLLAATRNTFEKPLLNELFTTFSHPQWGVTAKNEHLLVRYLGTSSEDCRRGFETVRLMLSTAGVFNINGTAGRPRIWNT